MMTFVWRAIDDQDTLRLHDALPCNEWLKKEEMKHFLVEPRCFALSWRRKKTDVKDIGGGEIVDASSFET